MQKIVPHLWYDTEAQEAAAFYTTVFPDSGIDMVTQIDDTPSGTAHQVSFQFAGQAFMAISAGPDFKFTSAISFRVACANPREAEGVWNKLAAGGSVLMEWGAYPFAQNCGWTADRYGLSWQVMYRTDFEIKQKITPTILDTLMNSGDKEKTARVTRAFLAMKKSDITALKKAFEGT